MYNIRVNTFETNSSSVHTMCICTNDEYEKWINGELYFDVDNNELVTYEEAKKADEFFPYSDSTLENAVDWFRDLKTGYCYEKNFLTFKEYEETSSNFESYENQYNVGGTDIVVFGYTGYDG